MNAIHYDASRPFGQATVQEIQFELMRRALNDDPKADRTIESLLAHRTLWQAP
jgi:hypothetical protein